MGAKVIDFSKSNPYPDKSINNMIKTKKGFSEKLKKALAVTPSGFKPETF